MTELTKTLVFNLAIEEDIKKEVNLIKNTIQRLIDKTYAAINAYYERDDYNRPKQKDDTYPLRSNHGEGYKLTLDNDQIRFRVGAIPYGQKVRGTLNGSDEHLSLVKQALNGDDWRIGTSEVVQRCGN